MRRNTVKSVLSGLALMSGVFVTSLPAMAQDAEAAPAAEQEDRVLDTVKVIGTQNDDAMAAFNAGDYAKAEIGFLDNARCALRRERNLSASIDTARINTARAEMFSNAASTDSGASSRGANAGAQAEAITGLAATDNISANNLQQKLDRTCEKRAFQLYMAGLSQLQLGKIEEAIENFERSTNFSRVQYDAHYRLGLISLLQGDQKTAQQQLNKVEGILKRCRRCEAKEEIIARRDHLDSALKGKVKLQ